MSSSSPFTRHLYLDPPAPFSSVLPSPFLFPLSSFSSTFLLSFIIETKGLTEGQRGPEEVDREGG